MAGAVDPEIRRGARARVQADLHHFVDGVWRAPADDDVTSVRADPATGEVYGTVPHAPDTLVDDAVRAAGRAFDPAGPWRSTSRRERARVLHRIGAVVRDHEAELAALITLENGKLYREALEDDMPDTADVFDYYAGWTDKYYGESSPVEGDALNLVVRDPIGVCALLVPWNFPLLLAAWKIAPALAMGNTVVVKPSPFTSYSLVRFAELVHEAGVLPPGVLNIVLGDGPTGHALVTSPGVAKVSFTGSTAVGRKILADVASSNLASTTLELGGKSPNIVFDDVADFDGCVERSFHLMFAQKGEKCSEPTRFLLQAGIYERFVDALVERAEAVVCGDPFDPTVTQGPQCTEAGLVRLLEHIDLAREDGARLRAGGERDLEGSNAAGLFLRPTIFDEVRPDMRLAREEVFGPVLACIPFSTEDEAVRIANDTPYGLAAGVYTGDPSRARRVARQLDAGQVFVNRYGCYDFAAPFGGVKASGWGREMGIHSLESYTRSRSIWFAG